MDSFVGDVGRLVDFRPELAEQGIFVGDVGSGG
jgi:hypothetical protein